MNKVKRHYLEINLDTIYKLITLGFTIREVAEEIGKSKSTVHRYIHKYGRDYWTDAEYNKVLECLEFNFEDKHNRGGQATREKWLEVKKRYGRV